MKLSADQKRILRFIILWGPTTFANVRAQSAGAGCRWLTQDLLAELAVLEESGLVSLALNKSGRHIRAM